MSNDHEDPAHTLRRIDQSKCRYLSGLLLLGAHRTESAGTAGIVVSLLLWNQMVEAEVNQRRLGLRIPIVEMFSNNPVLADLGDFEPDPADSVL